MEKLKLSILTIVLVFTISCQDNGGVNPIDSQSENIGSQPSENFVGLSTIGYYGSNRATYFGEAVPVISVQTVPLG